MKTQANNKKKTIKRVLLIISLFISVLFLSFGGVVVYYYNKYSLDINKLTSINNGVKVYSASMKDSTLYNSNRSIVKIDTLPNYVINAFVDTEDKRFFKHNGFDLKRIVKAGMINLSTKSKTQGASTISQQLVKNALLSNKKTFSRKIKEIVLSVKMEKKFSKNEILEMYLNTIYFGSNAYGIENASKTYFNKSAKDLTLNEVCCLAGIIKSPALYSPTKNYNNSIERRNLVAKLLLNANDISKNEYDEVISQPIILNQEEIDNFYEKEAIYEACNLLNINERELINKKYEIVTFKDDQLQQAAKVANDEITNKNENLDSLSIIMNNNGKVLSFYGKSNANLHNLARQPASTLKPLAVYLPCLIHNILTPSSLILDEKIDYNGYTPKNADGQYYGYVTTREAVSKSLNTVAVKALDYVGLKKANEVLTDLGINLDKADLNLTLALGATKNGVKIVDLLSAYSIVANLGEYKGVAFVDKILDENGKIVYKHEDYCQKVLDAADCFLLTDMLKDTAKTGTAKRLNDLSLQVASKTGTAFNGKNNTDLYNVAYTSEHTMLTWLGNLKNGKLPEDMLSSVEPTQINKQILQSLYKEHKPADFKCPSNVVRLPYDLNEFLNNHIIVEPATEVERYMKYDYFKADNPPKENLNKELQFDVEIDKTGCKLSFFANKSQNYKVFKVANNNKQTFADISEQSGKIELVDNNVFNFEEIIYILTTNNKEKQVKIRPKDYLINLLNSQILTNKKKWYV